MRQLFVTKAPPWTQAKQAALRVQDQTLIWLLIDREEAEVLTHGQVPEAVAEMAERALKGSAENECV